ncbi:hypothetical protein BC826DRAFT_1185996 [Russula brevipes]|nr:hypothetical protein BC826DRAFT_1185996 [Russula brevipes]
MAPSPSLALLAFLHRMRSSSLGGNLRIFTSRCLLLWLRILVKLKKIWSWYFRASSNGGKTEEITGRHPSAETSWKQEEYSAVFASRVFGGVGESSRRHSISESGIVQEPIELEAGIGRPQTVSHHPSLSSAPSISIRAESLGSSKSSGSTQPRPANCVRRPMHSEQVSRYSKKGDVPEKECRFRLSPMDVNLPHSYTYNQGLGDWVPFTHPLGALYFYHRSWRIFTDVYMYDPNLRAEIHKFSRLLNEEVLNLDPNGPPFPTNDYDLVLELVEMKDKEVVWLYYFVDHNKKTLFWLEHYDMSSLLYEIPGVTEPGHVKHRLESLYWAHWSLYPVGYEGRKFPRDAPKELLGVLLSSSIDSLTSRASTAPYSVADMETMRNIIKDAQDLGPDDAHAISSVARLLSICAQWRFMHFHGQKTSRQDRNKSIYAGDGHEHTKAFQVVSLFLFFHPDVHLKELERLWTDKLIYEEGWRNFMVMVQSEWEVFILNSSVVLAANVSFLSIPGVIPDQVNAWTKPSSAQVTSCMSLVFSIGGIISGLLLIRSTHKLAGKDVGTAWNYLDSMKNPHFHLEPLATMYSLPYGLLMWSVGTFFISLLLITFSKTREGIRVPLGVTVGLVGLLIIWCIVNLWNKGDGDSEYEYIED